MVHAGRTTGSRSRRPGAVAETAGSHQSPDDRSMRFMPEPSPGSSGASVPASSDAMNELTRWTRPVASYAAGSLLKNLRICGPVNRSNARDPVCWLSGPAPPTASVISRHSALVLESIQIGDSWRDSIGATCPASGCEGSSVPIPAAARRLRYTLPCCCAEPEIAAMRPTSRPLFASRPNITSSASAHMTGDDIATAGWARGSTPCLVP